MTECVARGSACTRSAQQRKARTVCGESQEASREVARCEGFALVKRMLLLDPAACASERLNVALISCALRTLSKHRLAGVWHFPKSLVLDAGSCSGCRGTCGKILSSSSSICYGSCFVLLHLHFSFLFCVFFHGSSARSFDTSMRFPPALIMPSYLFCPSALRPLTSSLPASKILYIKERRGSSEEYVGAVPPRRKGLCDRRKPDPRTQPKHHIYGRRIVEAKCRAKASSPISRP